eukprot:9400352-Lingulodinium_polyedra.AAC.1
MRTINCSTLGHKGTDRPHFNEKTDLIRVQGRQLGIASVTGQEARGQQVLFKSDGFMSRTSSAAPSGSTWP